MKSKKSEAVHFDDLDIHIVSHLIGADPFVIADRKIEKGTYVATFDYPLHNPVTASYVMDDDFTLESLVNWICHTYKDIYEEEKRTKPRSEAGHRSEGKYGIWAHALDELYIESVSCGHGAAVFCIGSRPSPFWVVGPFHSVGQFCELDRNYFADIVPRRAENGLIATGEIFDTSKKVVCNPSVTFEISAPTLTDLINDARAEALEICVRLKESAEA